MRSRVKPSAIRSWALPCSAAAALCLPLALGASALAGQAPALDEPCATEQRIARDRPVDDYMAELARQKKRRNSNPLPDRICILGWCRQVRSEAPPETPPLPPGSTTAPQAEAGSDPRLATRPGPSTSRDETGCWERYDPVRAAEHTEVGDHYFARRNYRAALSRYREALQNKPADPALHLRLGRTLEQMDEPPLADAHYRASLASPLEGRWKEEAQKGRERLRPRLRPEKNPPR